jgi:uncharacterized protein (DUF2147 family)
MRSIFLFIATFLAAANISVHAADSTSSPIGLWKTIDDKTGKPQGIVRVYEQEGRYFARIESGASPSDADRKCTACKDERKDQSLIGLVLMRNVKFQNGEFTGGDILDQNTGDVYRCNFKIEDNGNTLLVRGYLGISVFGRTQKWLREQN